MHPLLDPLPGRIQPKNFPKPAKILSKKNLLVAWKTSRDATRDPGRPGVDGLTAEQFAFRIDERLTALATDLRLSQHL